VAQRRILDEARHDWWAGSASSRTHRRVKRATARMPAFGRGERASRTFTLPFAGVGTLVVSSHAIRERVGAWAAVQLATRRPDAAAWRDAGAVAAGLGEIAAELLVPPQARETPPWEIRVPVPADVADLSARTLLPHARVRAMVDLLVSAETFDLIERLGDAWTVRARADVYETAPVLASIIWRVVRRRLSAVAGGPAALALIRELARRTSPGSRAGQHFERLTVSELSDATGYGKSALRSALSACETANLIEVRTRVRVSSYWRLSPAVFDSTDAMFTAPDVDHRRRSSDADAPAGPHGLQTPASVPPSPAPSRTSNQASTPAPAAPVPVVGMANSRRVSEDVARGAETRSPAAVLDIAGVRFPLPPGVQPDLVCDDDGSYWYKIGAVRLGPLRFG